MSDTRGLYEQVILDHNKNPRNFGALDKADRVLEGINPLCGDAFKIFVRFDGDTIADLRFDGHGCAISKSSASLMTTMLKGKTRAEAQGLFTAFHAMLRADMSDAVDEAVLGKLKVFSGVREYPMRIKCATLAWHALCAGLSPQAPPDTALSVHTE